MYPQGVNHPHVAHNGFIASSGFHSNPDLRLPVLEKSHAEGTDERVAQMLSTSQGAALAAVPRAETASERAGYRAQDSIHLQYKTPNRHTGLRVECDPGQILNSTDRGIQNVIFSQNNSHPQSHPTSCNTSEFVTYAEFSGLKTTLHTMERNQDKIIKMLLDERQKNERDEVQTIRHNPFTEAGSQIRDIAASKSTVEIKQRSEKIQRHVRDALSLSCKRDGSKCESSDTYSSCSVAALWAAARENRPAGKSIRSGSILGQLISEKLRSVSLPAMPFFPAPSILREEVFLPSLKLALGNMNGPGDEHITTFYSANVSIIDADVLRCLQNTYATRKKELVRAFLSSDSAKSIEKCFGSASSVDEVDYRKTEDSPIDDPRFAGAVRAAFRLKGRKVSLEQLAFACVTLIREYTKRNVQPALFRLVRCASESRVDYKAKGEMHGLMSASLATRLSKECTATTFGWKTPSFDVICQQSESATASLESFRQKLGLTIM